jgi:hypothetical protein
MCLTSGGRGAWLGCSCVIPLPCPTSGATFPPSSRIPRNYGGQAGHLLLTPDPGRKPISANLAEALRNWVSFLSRRDFTIVARQFIAWMAYEEGPRPGGTPDSGQA